MGYGARTFSHIQGVSKNLPESGEQYFVVLPFSFVFPGCLTRRVINAARVVLPEFTMKLNNFASDKKQLINGSLMFNDQ